MKLLIKFATLALLAAPALLPPTSVQAQVHIDVCGAPPLPPCRPRYEPRPYYDPYAPRYRPRYEDDYYEPRPRLSRTCVTRRGDVCYVGRPRPLGAECTCEDDFGVPRIGRVR